MINKSIVLSLISCFLLLEVTSIYAAPVREINTEYEENGISYLVAAAFYDRATSAQSLAIVDVQFDSQISSFPVKSVSENELKLAVNAYNKLISEQEFIEWAEEADYYVAIFAVDDVKKTGEIFYLTSRRVGKLVSINKKSWIIGES